MQREMLLVKQQVQLLGHLTHTFSYYEYTKDEVDYRTSVLWLLDEVGTWYYTTW